MATMCITLCGKVFDCHAKALDSKRHSGRNAIKLNTEYKCIKTIYVVVINLYLASKLMPRHSIK